MVVAALSPDLMFASRVLAAAAAGGATAFRIDHPDQLDAAASVDLVAVDWDARDATWTAALQQVRRSSGPPRLLLFGPHTDLAASQAAREAGLGPVMARSRMADVLATALAAPSA